MVIIVHSFAFIILSVYISMKSVGQLEQNFIWNLQALGEQSFFQSKSSQMTKMATMPYCDKDL